MYETFSVGAVSALGGAANITDVTHCATRLRFRVADKSLVDMDALKDLPETVGLIDSGGQIQLVIGMQVPDVYAQVLTHPGLLEEPEAGQVSAERAKKPTVLDRILASISAIFTPYIPVLASVGIIKGFLALALQWNWLADTSNTYAILDAAGNALIYFFPILLAFTAAKVFGANPYLGATIGAALMEPSLANINVTGERLDFMGIGFVGQSFAGTVIPIIIGMWAFAYLERFLKKVLPQITQLLLVPVISLIIMVPAMLLLFGPIGFGVANGVALVYEWLMQWPWLISIVFGSTFVFIIMIGAHWLVTPILLTILAEQGFEYALASGGMGNYAVLGVLLAVLMFTRDRETKTMAGSAAFVNAVAGITEPGLYGVIIKSKRYLLAVFLGGLAGGIICGIFDVYVTAFAFSGILGSPAFFASPRAVPYFLARTLSSWPRVFRVGAGPKVRGRGGGRPIALGFGGSKLTGGRFRSAHRGGEGQLAPESARCVRPGARRHKNLENSATG